MSSTQTVLFLGYAINPNVKQKPSGYFVAGNKMQVNILEQLSLYKNLKINAITVYPIAAFPKDCIYNKSQNINLTANVTSRSISFINIPVLKQLHQILSVYFYALKYMKNHPKSIILTYNLSPQIGIPAKWLSNKSKNVVALLADPPIDVDPTRKVFSRFIRIIFNKLAVLGINACNRFVVINKKLVSYYSLKGRSIVVEGGINPRDFHIGEANISSYEEKIILYTGSLTFYSGILSLIEAMEQVTDENIKLHIYGKGNLEKKVLDHAQKSNRIYFGGELPNDEILKIQQKAWLLVNPRIIDDPISQLTFPSKILEYMMSGVPVLTTRLNGFTDEYDTKLYFSDGDDSTSISSAINRLALLKDKDLKETALNARTFVIENKNWKKQTKKIYNFLIEDDYAR